MMDTVRNEDRTSPAISHVQLGNYLLEKVPTLRTFAERVAQGEDATGEVGVGRSKGVAGVRAAFRVQRDFEFAAMHQPWKVDFAIGTDTGGGVLASAACCGLFAFRPTFGMMPASGVVPVAPSFDTVSWMAREAYILRRLGVALLGTSRIQERLSMVSVKRVIVADDMVAMCGRNAMDAYMCAVTAI
eukprot:gene29619-36907_t